jgi:anti-sigma regulatory factor (Ser/Thr protein kinase)
VNSIRHGGCEDVAEAACISLQFQGREVRVIYSDRGAPFNPTAAPEPDLSASLADRPAGGLGVHLVRQIMSGIEYRREPDRNILTMSYDLPSQQEIQ